MRAKSLPLLVLLAVAACEKSEPKPESTTKKSEASPSKVEAIDPNLAEAVAAASVERPAGRGGPPQAEGGPPADGVFAPGAADKEILRGALPKITLGSEGSDPKQLLGPSKSAAKLTGTIQIALQEDPRQAPMLVLFDVTLEPKKSEAAKDDKAAVAWPVSVRVTAAKLDAPGALDERLAKLKGSKIEYSILPGGAGAGFRFETPKAAAEELKSIVRSLSDSLSLLTIPYPDKPLGAGGFFMVTSRDDFMGNDLVTYRMIKVKQVTAEGAKLEVSTKRYAANRTFELPGLPPDIDKSLGVFQAASEGSVQYPLGALLPVEGEISSVLAAELGAKDAKQRGVLQFQTRAQLHLK